MQCGDLLDRGDDEFEVVRGVISDLLVDRRPRRTVRARGDDEFEVVELLRALRREARALAAIACLLGNHEMMAVTGDLTFATPRRATASCASRPRSARGCPSTASGGPCTARSSSDGSRCRAAAFRPGGPLARALAELSGGEPIVARRGDSLFVHGGLLPAHLGDAAADADGGAAAAPRVRAQRARARGGTPLALLG